MYAIIAQVVRNMSMDIKRMPTAIANDISEFLYLHLLRAITTVAWQSSGRCKKEEIVLSSVCLLMSDAHSLSAGGRSTRLVEVVLRGWSNFFLCSTPYVTLQSCQSRMVVVGGSGVGVQVKNSITFYSDVFTFPVQSSTIVMIKFFKV